MLNTILKAGQVLALFDKDRPEWGISEAANELGVAKSSMHDLMSSLAEIGLLNQTDRGRYRLGWKLVDLSEILLSTTELRSVARPIMEQLLASYQETLHLALLENGRAVCLEKLEGRQAIRIELTGLGIRLYPHCSGVGKVLIAHQPWSEVLSIVNVQGMPRFTPNTITSVERLKQEMSTIRTQGYAIDNSEMIPDMCCVAAPVRDYTGEVVAAISMSMPEYRFQRARSDFRNAILRASRVISRQLGHYDS